MRRNLVTAFLAVAGLLLATVGVFAHHSQSGEFDNSKPIEMVRSGQAHIAVTGKEEPGLNATQIGWDGIAVMVSLSNHTKEVTAQQVADIFSGKVRSWSDLGGPETRILLIDRPRNRNIRDAFEQVLGIAGKIPDSAKVIGPDDKVIKTVAGTLPPLSAVTYLSLGQALAAVTTGVAVRLLPLDKVEPEEPTVKDGRYKLRRPVLPAGGTGRSTARGAASS